MRCFFFITLFLLSLAPLKSTATVYQVPMQYPTIQAGINAAAVGDTVQLESGVYYGPGNRDIDFLGKDIVVRSHDGNPSTCTIFCLGTVEAPHRGFIFQSGESHLARLEGVTISDGYMWTEYPDEDSGGGIICINNSSPTISNCRITQCEATGNGGGFFSSYSSPTLINCKIDNNSSGGGGGGIAVGGNLPFVMTGCLVTDNSCGYGYDGLLLSAPSSLVYECTFANHSNTAVYSESGGTLSRCTLVNNYIAIQGSPHMTIENTLVAFNQTGFYDYGAATHNISCCDVYGNGDGDWVGSVEHHGNINGNISADPFLCDPLNWDYQVAPNSPCLVGSCGQIGSFGAGQCESLSQVSESPEQLFGLLGNYPNPFNPNTTISFTLEQESAVQLQIYDVSGKLVKTLVDETSLSPGRHQAIWRGRDDDGQQVSAGVFLYVLSTPHGKDTGRMALIK